MQVGSNKMKKSIMQLLIKIRQQGYINHSKLEFREKYQRKRETLHNNERFDLPVSHSSSKYVSINYRAAKCVK